ncbi:DUF4188 domain-containing protein [Streptomyces sp. SAJ15]|uniref:DUF4188 domain-containing protein n=1 Tax=Streptomyces sp. SAJ15 TaxID=2011095 RepID=UPI001185CC8E|nr:DUF4188 domain-containing protein [Streptomyces sp. SAJ15]TVL94310.1 hypothetical protein CD790_04890 [Streptomyces sp. SAJ15]
MSSKPIPGRYTADVQGDVTVFHIGMRFNSFRAVRSWWPVFTAMPRMLKELSQDKESGMLGYQLLLGWPRLLYVVQYWESPEKLLAYAADQGKEHRPAWAAFNRRLREGRGKVGFWHETFISRPGSYENVYINMPPFGLAAATGGPVPVARRGERAADRLKPA